MFVRNEYSKIAINQFAEILSFLEIQMMCKCADPSRSLHNLQVLLYWTNENDQIIFPPKLSQFL